MAGNGDLKDKMNLLSSLPKAFGTTNSTFMFCFTKLFVIQ
jgi:hypothetical protein